MQRNSDSRIGFRFSSGVVKRGKIEPDEVERFKWAIMLARRYPPVMIQRGGYDTLVASGDLSILRDPELRTRLVSLYTYFDSIPQRVIALTGGQNVESPYSSTDMYAVPHPSGKGILWKVDYTAVTSNPATLGYLTSERRNHTLVGEGYADGAKRAAELREYIGDVLNRN